MSDRLSTASKDLSLRIRSASAQQCRMVAAAVARAAIARAGVIDDDVAKALEMLGQGLMPPLELQDVLRTKLDSFDDEYLDAEEAGRPDQSIAAFRSARAVGAVYCAANADVTVAALDSTYEASIVFGNTEAVETIVNDVLRGPD
jgi:hypothetical protein